MSNTAQSWAWKQSPQQPSDKAVLVALADNAWEDGSNAWPSVKLLATKTGFSERTVQRCLQRLMVAGYIAVQVEAQPKRSRPTTYQMDLNRPSEVESPGVNTSPRDTTPPGETVTPPDIDDCHPVTLSADPPVTVTPEPLKNQLLEPSELLPATEVAAAAPTDGQRINEITKAYAEAEPLSNFPAIRGVVSKAFKTGEFTDDEIRDALLRLASEGRSVTTNTLRIELRGYPGPKRDPGGLNRTNQRNLAVVEQFARGEIA